MDRETILDLTERLSGQLDAAYRRAIQYGYSPPAVFVRIHGDFDRTERGELVVKAVDVDELVAGLDRAGFAERAEEMRCFLTAVPEGHYPIIVVDEGPDDPCVVSRPVPDQN
jgi:hypothetical protein